MNSKSASLQKLSIPTNAGVFHASYSQAGLASLNFPDESPIAPMPASDSIDPQIRSWHRRTTEALLAIWSGASPKVFPPFDLSAGTEFQQRVWRALEQIRFGETRSYQDVAAAIGNPKAVRAVGGACGANPIPVLIPCHRVLAAKNKLGGFSGGLNWKRLLLEREGILISAETPSWF